MSLALDIINFAIIVDLANKYADNIKHECKVQQRHNLYNKTRSFEDKCNWYLTQLKSDITPEQSEALKAMIDDLDSLGGLELFEYAIMLEPDKRSELKNIITALKDNKRLEVKILE